MYLTKIQSLDDEKMICLGKGKGESARGNLKMIDF